MIIALPVIPAGIFAVTVDKLHNDTFNSDKTGGTSIETHANPAAK